MKKKKKFVNWMKRLIPAYIEVRSLYWLQHEKEMNRDLVEIFHSIDTDDYDRAKELIAKFESTYTQSGVPYWVGVKYAEIYRAQSMLDFLKN